MDDLERTFREILARENGEEGIHLVGLIPSKVVIAAMHEAYRLGVDACPPTTAAK